MTALTGSVIAIAVAYASAFLPGGATVVSAMLMIAGIATMAVALMTLGAVRDGTRAGPIGFALGFLFLVLVAGFSVPLFLNNADPASQSFLLGLPTATAIVVYGVGILPVLVLPLVYVWTFDDRTLNGEDIERIRKLARERKNEGSAS